MIQSEHVQETAHQPSGAHFVFTICTTLCQYQLKKLSNDTFLLSNVNRLPLELLSLLHNLSSFPLALKQRLSVLCLHIHEINSQKQFDLCDRNV